MKSPQDMRIIQIDITNACMYQCSNCTRFCGHHQKNFFMDFDTFKRAVKSLKGYHGTIGMMGGEPTLHPDFELFADYLKTQMTGEYKKNDYSLIRPQRDFIETVLRENEVQSEVYHYHTGDRETNVGAGLWSAMVPSYKKYYETIQDTFKMQAVNDHGNIMYHSPILINRRDLGIPDDDWIKIRDNCWAQCAWSATITPKGAFFCEIAGALDMLFDGPGGWPIEEGWWKRNPDQFGDQLNWCEYCGIAINTFTRDANDWVDDVSESMYKKLQEIGSLKLKNHPERINLVKIEDGVISEDSKTGVKEVRHELFYDSFESRFNRNKSVLYPDGIDLIIDCKDALDMRFKDWYYAYKSLFRKIVVCTRYGKSSASYSDDEKINILYFEDEHWGHTFTKAVKICSNDRPIIYTDQLVEFNTEKVKDLLDVIFNPGTLHIVHFSYEQSDYTDGCEDHGIMALFHKNARSIREIGLDGFFNATSFKSIENKWNKNKIVKFDSSMIEDSSVYRIQPGKKYVIYGAGESGRDALDDVKNMNSQVIAYVDSNKGKWGTIIEGISVISPEQMKKKRNQFDKIIIATMYYKEVIKTLKEMGLKSQDYIVHV